MICERLIQIDSNPISRCELSRTYKYNPSFDHCSTVPYLHIGTHRWQDAYEIWSHRCSRITGCVIPFLPCNSCLHFGRSLLHCHWSGSWSI